MTKTNRSLSLVFTQSTLALRAHLLQRSFFKHPTRHPCGLKSSSLAAVEDRVHVNAVSHRSPRSTDCNADPSRTKTHHLVYPATQNMPPDNANPRRSAYTHACSSVFLHTASYRHDAIPTLDLPLSTLYVVLHDHAADSSHLPAPPPSARAHPTTSLRHPTSPSPHPHNTLPDPPRPSLLPRPFRLITAPRSVRTTTTPPPSLHLVAAAVREDVLLQPATRYPPP
ncbi:hypothetical protein R3P38DRAFT_3230929 [Favolaschia claudopus]|uniref:Uncharacterized protein n=1 Tax=Favolaschia claudopus TaxID=2862362 RepID=A0AAV9ZKZ9_9AGAR